MLVRFFDCTFPHKILLTDAKIIGIDFIAGQIEAIVGDRLTANGSLRFNNTFFGWLMTTLFVAGVSSLIRTKEG